jgi:hypothetical protein
VDPKEETKHIQHHDVMVKSVDYSHSQANELDENAPPKSLVQKKPPVDSRISHPKYWLGIIIVVVFYSTIATYLSLMITDVIYICVFGLMYLSITKLLKRGNDGLTKRDKYRMVMFMALTPIVGQMLYYIRLKEKMPIAARLATWIGWRVLAIFVIGAGIYIAIAVTQSWQFRYGTQFQSQLNIIAEDLNSITADAREYDSPSLQNNCTKLAHDADDTKALPQYPDVHVQDGMSLALNKLHDGAKECASAVKAGDADKLLKANTELKQGYGQLRLVVSQMKSV